MRSRKFLLSFSVLILAFGYLAACTGEEVLEPTPLPTGTATTTPVWIPEEGSTPIAVFQEEEELLEGLKETEEYIPPTPTPMVFVPPAWMQDPDTVILAAAIDNYIEQTRVIAFFNAGTGERYDFGLSEEYYGFFWYDNMHFGILSADRQTASRMSLGTGEISEEAVPPQATQLLGDSWPIALLQFHDEANDEMYFDHASGRDKSASRKYTVEWLGNRDNIQVVDRRTSELIWEPVLPEWRYITEAAWSPVNENQLAIVQASMNHETGYPTEAVTLSIVNVRNGEILAYYEGDFGVTRWSPDGRLILFQDMSNLYWNTMETSKEPPCILNLETGEQKCFTSIPYRVPEGYDLSSTWQYTWAEDSKSVLFAYDYFRETDKSSLSDLCIYDLRDGHIDCPTQNSEAFIDHRIIGIDSSPDEQYIAFCRYHWLSGGKTGVIGRDGSGFFSWTGAFVEDGAPGCSPGVLWRPEP